MRIPFGGSYTNLFQNIGAPLGGISRFQISHTIRWHLILKTRRNTPFCFDLFSWSHLQIDRENCPNLLGYFKSWTSQFSVSPLFNCGSRPIFYQNHPLGLVGRVAVKVVKAGGVKGAACMYWAPQTMRFMTSAAAHYIIKCRFWTRQGSGATWDDPFGPEPADCNFVQHLEIFIEYFFGRLRSIFRNGYMSLHQCNCGGRVDFLLCFCFAVGAA